MDIFRSMLWNANGQNLTDRKTKFVEAVQRAGWTFLRPDDLVDPTATPHLIMIGTVIWSSWDLWALDILVQWYEPGKAEIAVFDVDSLLGNQGESIETYHERYKKLMPAAPSNAKCPVLAEYNDGALIYFCEGITVVDRALQLCVT